MSDSKTLDDIGNSIDQASIDRTHNAVDYSPFYRIALKLVVWTLKMHYWRELRDESD